MPAAASRQPFPQAVAAVLSAVALTFLCGCVEPDAPPSARPDVRLAGVITLGDIDPDEPATRVRRLQPLADYMADSLQQHGIGRGRVVITRNIEEMAGKMKNGEVDFLLDSPYPVLAVNALAGSKNFLLRHAQGDANYWSVFVTRMDSGLRTLEDLKGNVVVFQEPHSTSGFLLPAAMLIDRGFVLEAAARPDGGVAADSIGCYFSGDEENTVELVFSGRAPAGVISSPDYRALPAEAREQLLVIDRTTSVPRQLVSVRPELDASLKEAVRTLLLSIDDADRAMLADKDKPFGWTWKFDALSAPVAATLEQLEGRIGTLSGCGSRR